MRAVDSTAVSDAGLAGSPHLRRARSCVDPRLPPACAMSARSRAADRWPGEFSGRAAGGVHRSRPPGRERLALRIGDQPLREGLAAEQRQGWPGSAAPARPCRWHQLPTAAARAVRRRTACSRRAVGLDRVAPSRSAAAALPRAARTVSAKPALPGQRSAWATISGQPPPVRGATVAEQFSKSVACYRGERHRPQLHAALVGGGAEQHAGAQGGELIRRGAARARVEVGDQARAGRRAVRGPQLDTAAWVEGGEQDVVAGAHRASLAITQRRHRTRRDVAQQQRAGRGARPPAHPRLVAVRAVVGPEEQAIAGHGEQHGPGRVAPGTDVRQQHGAGGGAIAAPQLLARGSVVRLQQQRVAHGDQLRRAAGPHAARGAGLDCP